MEAGKYLSNVLLNNKILEQLRVNNCGLEDEGVIAITTCELVVFQHISGSCHVVLIYQLLLVVHVARLSIIIRISCSMNYNYFTCRNIQILLIDSSKYDVQY